MSLMTKRSFRHWQKSSKKSISKITKQHIVVVIVIVTVIIIAAAVPQIVQHLKVENSKPPLLYLLSSTGLEASWKSNLQKTTTKQNKGKRRKKQRTHT
jgi:NADH:ubiquinone oxidoreductase subunit 4 (subunit M)